MNAIEEAAKEYAENSNVTQENFCLYDEIDAFEAGANYLMSLPLCDRLTSKEREKIKELYKENHIYNMLRMEDLFGTAMFEEKGGEDV